MALLPSCMGSTDCIQWVMKEGEEVEKEMKLGEAGEGEELETGSGVFQKTGVGFSAHMVTSQPLVTPVLGGWVLSLPP